MTELNQTVIHWSFMSPSCCRHNVSRFLHCWTKRCLDPRMRYLLGDYWYSICWWGSKTGCLAGFMVFLCITSTVLFDVHFGKFVMTFIDIREIGGLGKPEYHWIVIVVNLVKQTLSLAVYSRLYHFSDESFLEHIESVPFHTSEIFDDINDIHWSQNNLHMSAINCHALLKTKFVRVKNTLYIYE